MENILGFQPVLECLLGYLYEGEIENLLIAIPGIEEKFSRHASYDLYKSRLASLKSVRENSLNLKNISDQTFEICIEALKKNVFTFEYVKNKTEDICICAVKQSPVFYSYGLSEEYLTEKVYYAAISAHRDALYWIKNQTYEMCMYAVNLHGDFLKDVKIPQTDELCLAAVKNYGNAIKYVKNQTEEICLAAVKRNPISLQYIKVQTGLVCFTAAKTNRSAIPYIIDPTLRLKIIQKLKY